MGVPSTAAPEWRYIRDPTGGNAIVGALAEEVVVHVRCQKGLFAAPVEFSRALFANVDCAELLEFGAVRFFVLLFVFVVVLWEFRESELRAVLYED